MGSPNPKTISDYRYHALKLKESISNPYQFSLACKELSFILRHGYSKFPKNLQSIVFQETLYALSLLPQMRAQSALSAANLLLQSAEFVLPKQKKSLAAKEYKHAIVLSKRKSRANEEEEGLILLPQDILVHIFNFLDFQSVVSASAVCWSWNDASRDNKLWKILNGTFFCKFDNDLKLSGLNTSGMIKNNENIYSSKEIDAKVAIDWRFAFKTAYTEIRSQKFKSHRGYCFNCRSIVWITSDKCSDTPYVKGSSNHQIKPISTQQIVDHILDGSLSSESYSTDSDSESDGEDAPIFKLWAYPRQSC